MPYKFPFTSCGGCFFLPLWDLLSLDLLLLSTLQHLYKIVVMFVIQFILISYYLLLLYTFDNFMLLIIVWQQVKLREMKPGMLSQELKEALGMPEGAPPPWLINMQVR